MISGHPKAVVLSSEPAIRGLIAVARLFGTAVMLAAAGRSAGVTTAITYEVRAGTSICASALRINRHAIARSRFGMNGARIRKTLAGRCVNTIVLIRPMRFARIGANNWENAESNPLQKKIVPAVETERSNFRNSHNASTDCRVNPLANESTLNSAARR